MGAETKIQWCHHTFNGWIGCTENGPECDHCYAREQNKHWKWNGGEWGPGALRKVTSPSKWREPLKWNRDAKAAGERRRVCAFSLADVADAEAPAEMYPLLWALVEECDWIDWLFLTKRPHRIREIVPAAWRDNPPKNAWWGTSVGTQKTADAKVPHLLRAPAAVRFLSMEPLLEKVDVREALIGDVTWNQHGDETRRCAIDWVIVGGESGHGARPMRLEWAHSIVEQCKAAGVPVFVKQLGAHPSTCSSGCTCTEPEPYHLKLDRAHDGDMAEWPEDLRVREFPRAAR